MLGGGAARGWAHIGAIRALHDAGIKPDVVCGTSIGALVGAVYANGDLDWLEEWVSRLTWQTVVRLLDLRFSGGLLGGRKVIQLFADKFNGRSIAQLNMPFAAVATELDSGARAGCRTAAWLTRCARRLRFRGFSRRCGTTACGWWMAA